MVQPLNFTYSRIQWVQHIEVLPCTYLWLVPGAGCRPSNIRTFWGWSPNPRTVLGLDLFWDWELSSGVVSPYTMRGQLCINTFVSYKYSTNHMSFLFITSQWIFRSNKSGLAKETIPNLLLWWLNGKKWHSLNLGQPEFVQRHCIMPYCTAKIGIIPPHQRSTSYL